MRSMAGPFWWWHFGCKQGIDEYPRFCIEFNINKRRAYLFKIQPPVIWLPTDEGWFGAHTSFQVHIYLWRFELIFTRWEGRINV